MWNVLITSIFLISCAPKRPQLPCWVYRPCGNYSEQKYIIGVGSGESQSLADDEARAALAKRFQVRIQQVQESSKDTREFATEEGINTSSRQSLRSDTVTSVAIELQGIEIVDRHKQGDMYYTLGVLERAPLLKGVDDQLKDLDKESRTYIEEARGAASKIARAAAYHKAVPLLDKMELLNQRRVILDPRGESWDFFASALQVRHEESSTLRQIRVQIQSDPSSVDVVPLLVETLTIQGFSVVNTDADLLLSVRGSEFMLPPDNFGFSKTRVKMLLRIVEPSQKNRLIFEKNLQGEAASQDLYKSRQFALNQVLEQIEKEKVGQALEKIILGEGS